MWGMFSCPELMFPVRHRVGGDFGSSRKHCSIHLQITDLCSPELFVYTHMHLYVMLGRWMDQKTYGLSSLLLLLPLFDERQKYWKEGGIIMYSFTFFWLFFNWGNEICRAWSNLSGRWMDVYGRLLERRTCVVDECQKYWEGWGIIVYFFILFWLSSIKVMKSV